MALGFANAGIYPEINLLHHTCVPFDARLATHRGYIQRFDNPLIKFSEPNSFTCVFYLAATACSCSAHPSDQWERSPKKATLQMVPHPQGQAHWFSWSVHPLHKEDFQVVIDAQFLSIIIGRRCPSLYITCTSSLMALIPLSWVVLTMIQASYHVELWEFIYAQVTSILLDSMLGMRRYFCLM